MADYNTDRLTIGSNTYRVKDTVSGYVDSSYHDSTKQDLISSSEKEVLTATATQINTTAASGITASKVSTYDGYATGKQDTLTTQTAYSAKGSATKVPQITTNTLGQVTGITEVTITQPTVNNGTLTIKKGDTTLGTFTANQSTATSVDVKTSLSDLSVTATAAELNVLDGITATTAELNYTDGVTSNIQTQLNGKIKEPEIIGDDTVLRYKSTEGGWYAGSDWNVTSGDNVIGVSTSDFLSTITAKITSSQGNVTLSKESDGLKANISDSALTIAKTSGLQTALNNKSSVSVSSSGSSTNQVQYITVDGTEYKLSGGSSGGVTGVKGNAESSYRTGNVNITAANIGVNNYNISLADGLLTITEA